MMPLPAIFQSLAQTDPSSVPGRTIAPEESIDLYLQSMAFYPNGAVCWITQPDQSSWAKWTKGFVLNGGAKTSPAYEIRWIGGDKYMFLEWKSGDYTDRHCLPMYYVLQWIGEAPHVTQPSH
jgi:hypothetical protein